jgi:exopolysaccharide biosynthesis polyprenyl glycosylphosphotransferase
MVESALSRGRFRRPAHQHPLHRTIGALGSPLPASRPGTEQASTGAAPAGVPLAAAPASGARWASSYRTKLRVTDTAIIAIAVATTFLMRFSGAAAEPPTSATASRFAVMCALVLVVWVSSLSAFRTRDPRVVGVGVSEYKRVAHATTTTFGLLAVVFLLFQADTARWFLTVSFPLGLFFLLSGRWIWRQWLMGQREAGHFLSRVIVIGKQADVEKVVGQIRRSSGAAYSVVGAVVEEGESDAASRRLDELVVLTGLSRAADFARTLGVEGVVVAGHPSGGSEYIHDLAWQLEGTTADLILATSLANVAGPRIHFRPVEGLPLIHVEIPQFEGAKHLVKRAMDVTIAGLALLFLAPAFAVIAIMVRLDSEGGALFAQERVGRGGQPFRMIKFRSMVASAPQLLGAIADRTDGNGVLFKMKNDPRVTRLGRILRKYSLDELPQLWNVLVGDMSLVGPRPPLAHEVSAYEDHVHRRLYIKPGLTGMWQVNGRSNLSWEDSVRLDLYYVENWSLMGDIIILWRTVKVVARPVGAY